MRQIRILLTALGMVLIMGQAQAQTWLPIVDDTFGRGPTSYGAANSTNVGNPTHGPSSGWTDLAGNSWLIDGSNILQGKGSFRTNVLLRPAAEATLNQQVVIYPGNGAAATTADWWAVLRYVDNNNMYLVDFIKGSATQMTAKVYAYKGGSFSGQLATTATFTIASTDTLVFTATIQQDTIDTTRCLITANIQDVTASTSINLNAGAYYDSYAALQVPGRTGLSVNDSTNSSPFLRVTINNSPVFSANGTTSGVTLSASQGGGAYYPVSAQWYRSTSFNFTPGGGNAIGSPVTISSPGNFANYNDTSAVAGNLYFYKCVLTDSAVTPNTLTSPQMAGAVYSSPNNLAIGFIGDSTYGQISGSGTYMASLGLAGATGGTFTLTYNGTTTSAIAYNANALTIAAALGIGSSQSSYVYGPVGGPFTIIYTSGTSATAKISLNSASLTGVVGTPSVTEILPSETAPSIMCRLLQTSYGLRVTTLPSINSSGNINNEVNRGIGGTTSGSWVSGGGNLNAAKTAFAAAGVTYVMIDLGINDGRDSVANSNATYQTNLSGTVTDLVGAGYRVILNYPAPPQVSSGDYGPTCAARVVGYQSVINTIVSNFASSNPGYVFLGDTRWWQYQCLHPTVEVMTPDLIHPNAIGARVKAECMAQRVAAILGISPSASAKRKVQ